MQTGLEQLTANAYPEQSVWSCCKHSGSPHRQRSFPCWHWSTPCFLSLISSKSSYFSFALLCFSRFFASFFSFSWIFWVSAADLAWEWDTVSCLFFRGICQNCRHDYGNLTLHPLNITANHLWCNSLDGTSDWHRRETRQQVKEAIRRKLYEISANQVWHNFQGQLDGWWKRDWIRGRIRESAREQILRSWILLISSWQQVQGIVSVWLGQRENQRMSMRNLCLEFLWLDHNNRENIKVVAGKTEKAEGEAKYVSQATRRSSMWASWPDPCRCPAPALYYRAQ